MPLEAITNERWIPVSWNLNSTRSNVCPPRVEGSQFSNPHRSAFKNKLARDDGLLLAFDAFVLSKSLGREVAIGKIIHGDERAAMTVKTSALAGEVRKRIEKITELLSSPTDTKGDQRNAHGHIFMTSRVVDEDGDFSKTKIRSLEIANVAPSKSGGFAKCGRCVAIAPCEKLDFRKT